MTSSLTSLLIALAVACHSRNDTGVEVHDVRTTLRQCCVPQYEKQVAASCAEIKQAVLADPVMKAEQGLVWTHPRCYERLSDLLPPLLHDESLPPVVLRLALLHARRVAPSQTMSRELFRLVRTRNQEVSREAIEVLAELGEEELAPLTEMLKSEDPRERSIAVSIAHAAAAAPLAFSELETELERLGKLDPLAILALQRYRVNAQATVEVLANELGEERAARIFGTRHALCASEEAERFLTALQRNDNTMVAMVAKLSLDLRIQRCPSSQM